MGGRISRAFLLAAGLGTRLRPLTDYTPKCLLPIHGRPLLSIWLDICEQLGVEQVLINTHHLPERVRDWATTQSSRVRITLAHEEVLKGSAGTVAANRDFSGQDDFYIFYADNLVRADLDQLHAFHAGHGGVLTLGLFHTPRPKQCGIVTLDGSGRVTRFEEKPAYPPSDLANAGLMVARRGLFECLPQDRFADFGRDVLPSLVGRMWGLPVRGYIRDIGTPESYRKALEEWPALATGEKAGGGTAPGAEKKFVLLDRDGVINRRVPNGYVTRWEEFEFLPGALEALRLLNAQGYRAIVISNQACVGKGLLSVEGLNEITARFMQVVEAHGGKICGIYHCPHRPEDKCDCRKPKPGLFLQAQEQHGFRLQDTYMVGDSESDLQAARKAGCHALLVANAAGDESSCASSEATFPDLLAAVRFLLDS